MNDGGKSDSSIVPAKPPNNPARAGAEVVEERGLPEGNAAGKTRPGHRAGQGAPSALGRVRQVAQKDKDAKFTALLHHVDVDRLRDAYFALRPKAAPGVDGVTWHEYGQALEENLRDLHERVHCGSYRAKPVRRTYIPKRDGRLRPLGIAALEDKILQRAVVEVLSSIYETDFLGFSYGFRPGRSPHHALDALATAIKREKVNWVLDADIRDYFTSLDQSWLDEVPQAPDRGQENPALDPEMARRRGHRERGMVGDHPGDGARSVNFAATCQRLPALRLRPVGAEVAAALCARGYDPFAVR